MSKLSMTPWNDPAYFESRARDERAFAEEDRKRRFGTVESMQIHLQNAAAYEAKAAELRAAQAKAAQS
jgi:hypothetical protein